MSPCIAPAWTSCRASLWTSRSAPRFVRTKTRASPRSWASSRARVSTFVSAVTGTNLCSTAAWRCATGSSASWRAGAGGDSCAGHAGHDAVDLRLEAHVEHPVGLVEDEDLDTVELHRPAVEQVLQAAGRR